MWVVLSKLWAPWRAAAQLMQPATVKAWHTRAFRLYWRWKSRKKPGRPSLSQEMQDLIRKLSRENPLWGAEVIRDTLLNLRYDPPCEDTIRKYMVKPRNPRGKSTARVWEAGNSIVETPKPGRIVNIADGGPSAGSHLGNVR